MSRLKARSGSYPGREAGCRPSKFSLRKNPRPVAEDGGDIIDCPTDLPGEPLPALRGRRNTAMWSSRGEGKTGFSPQSLALRGCRRSRSGVGHMADTWLCKDDLCLKAIIATGNGGAKDQFRLHLRQEPFGDR